MEDMYWSVIEAATIEELRYAAYSLLSALTALYEKMRGQFVPNPSPTYENLRGTYEELWCNCMNKAIASVKANDASYAFHAALGAQAYLDEMTAMVGTPHFDLMQHFDAKNLTKYLDAFLQVVKDYAAIYDQAGRKIEQYDSFESLYDDYMNGRPHP